VPVGSVLKGFDDVAISVPEEFFRVTSVNSPGANPSFIGISYFLRRRSLDRLLHNLRFNRLRSPEALFIDSGKCLSL
jgi:hypothetical protein